MTSTISFWTEKLGAALDIQKGVTFWVAIQLKKSHPTKIIEKVFPVHLITGKLRLLHWLELQDRLHDVERLILMRKVGFVRENWGLVVDDLLNFHIKISKFHPMGRGFQKLPKCLWKKHAIVNVKNHENLFRLWNSDGTPSCQPQCQPPQSV